MYRTDAAAKSGLRWPRHTMLDCGNTIHPILLIFLVGVNIVSLMCSIGMFNFSATMGHQPLPYNSTTPREMFHSTSKKCSKQTQIQNSDYKSQSNEDKKLIQWFGNLCAGSYIEMGALDGITYSNSHVFNKALQWKGVLIELSGDSYDKLIVNRPNEHAVINAGVCDIPKKLHYFSDPQNPAISGIYEFSAPSFREHWWKGIALDDPRVKEIECDTMNNLLSKHTPTQTYWDFFSLDVEGAEFSVLQSVDFDRVGFGIIFVEANSHNPMKNLALREFLESNGYSYLEEYERSYWFVNQNFHEIYKDLMY